MQRNTFEELIFKTQNIQVHQNFNIAQHNSKLAILKLVVLMGLSQQCVCSKVKVVIWASVMYVADWKQESLHPAPGPSEFSWTEKGQEVDGPPSVVEVWMWSPGTQYGR